MAVEPIAAQLGATKGSFYWHFRDRGAWIEAALQLWEEEHTEAVIASLTEVAEPAQRLRVLLALVIGTAAHDRLEVALAATADHPMVAPVMRRITERRVGYVAEIFGQLGLPPQAARHRALFSVSVYLGHLQLAHVAPHVLPAGGSSDWASHLDQMVETLLAH